jgi:hypothetical protein
VSDCAAFRADWLSAGYDFEHVESCDECRAWVVAIERRIHALNDLTDLVAPAELDQRVAGELAGDRQKRNERAAGSLARLGAPADLDAAVAELFGGREPAGDAERGERAARTVRMLEIVPAPSVLERLVAEELAKPALQRAERFPGNLERLEAPEELREKLHGSVRRRAALRLLRAPLAALAAAALVVWVALQMDDAPASRSYRFEVVRATSLADLDPMLRSMAEGLTGGGER